MRIRFSFPAPRMSTRNEEMTTTLHEKEAPKFTTHWKRNLNSHPLYKKIFFHFFWRIWPIGILCANMTHVIE